MSIEDLRNTAHTRDMIISRLDADIRNAYQRASHKAWRAAMKGEDISYTHEETRAVELVEQKLLDTLHHKRFQRTKVCAI